MSQNSGRRPRESTSQTPNSNSASDASQSKADRTVKTNSAVKVEGALKTQTGSRTSGTAKELPPLPRIGATQVERTIGLSDPTEVSASAQERNSKAQTAGQTATVPYQGTSGGGSGSFGKTPTGSWGGSGYNPLATNLHSLDIEDGHEGPDERWLVSYADMMTLLFGLFVMLFSLSSQYKGDLERAIQRVSQKTFGAVQGGAYSGGTDIVPDEIEGLRTKLETTLAELSEYRAREEREKTKMSQADILAERDEEIRRLKKLVEEMRADLKSARESAGGGGDLASRLHKVESANEALRTENSKLAKHLAQTRVELDSKNGKGAGSFMALVIHWDTRNHDIDLVVEDPKGKKFDFKNRGYRDYPGTFTLDTRRGPGAEIWQTDRIIPGTYKITYSFYSQYGNTEPARVMGTLSSVRGKKELPPIQLDFSGKRSFTQTFKVDQDGNITLGN